MSIQGISGQQRVLSWRRYSSQGTQDHLRLMECRLGQKKGPLGPKEGRLRAKKRTKEGPLRT